MPGQSSKLATELHARPRILLADDEEALLRVAARVLERAGFDVTPVNDGAQALELLADHSFDAIVSDCNMPGTDGLALLQAVRERALDVPVLLLSGSSGLDSEDEAVGLGACGYLLKPVSNEELVTTLRRVLSTSVLAKTRRESTRLDGGRSQASDEVGLSVTGDRALASR